MFCNAIFEMLDHRIDSPRNRYVSLSNEIESGEEKTDLERGVHNGEQTTTPLANHN